MRRSRFSVEQIVAVLKQVELGMAVADACRKMGISEQTFYRWKKQYGCLEPDQARELTDGLSARTCTHAKRPLTTATCRCYRGHAEHFLHWCLE